VCEAGIGVWEGKPVLMWLKEIFVPHHPRRDRVELSPMQRTLFFSTLSLSTSALALAPHAHAQSTGLIPVRVKIGALLPSQGGAKTNAGTVIPAAEVDVRIPSFLGGSFATLGYQQGSKRGGRLRVIPLTLSRTFSPPNPAGRLTGNVYVGVGTGPYFLQGRGIGGSSINRTTLGGFVQVGYQTPTKFFIEAKYQLTAQRAGGLSPNGLLLFVGRSF